MRYILLIFGLILIAGAIIWGLQSYSEGDLFSVIAAPGIGFIGLVLIFIWFLEFFKTPRP